MRRRFSQKISSSAIKKLDAFPKVADVCVETSVSGGTVSLFTFTLMAVLTVGEYCYYRDTWINYSYQVDTDISRKLQVNIDITVAMKCDCKYLLMLDIGADVTDRTGMEVGGSGDFHYEPTHFELSAKDRAWQRKMQNINRRLQKEHSLLDTLIKSPFSRTTPAEGPRFVSDSTVVGRITGGDKSAHQSEIGHLELYMFQYFLIVVPTEISTYTFSTSTYQFSVSEQEKNLAGMGRKHEVPGVLVKYDISCLKILISEEGMSTNRFLIRLCGIVGGIFSTAGVKGPRRLFAKQRSSPWDARLDLPVINTTSAPSQGLQLNNEVADPLFQ
ncbi:endoplasmic reticulum-Golgi intermediate compartment protein 2-like [Pristis pectinata]|uniref:endoplasmic reticulum-Golgi intermediate compartment protein 2-like n=1 Tax=Pristis pectinata TaxID=685728 RepID=UPI00223E2710|nr:endoplasmic reticulum-Golgi intermediate compartment protein 2-like [Pristis pectinata]